MKRDSAMQNLIGLYLHGESQVVNASLTMSYAKEYLAIMLFTFVPFGVTQIYASSLRETGESIKPMVAGIASVVIDVVFNYFLIYGKFGFPELGRTAKRRKLHLSMDCTGRFLCRRQLWEK